MSTGAGKTPQGIQEATNAEAKAKPEHSEPASSTAEQTTSTDRETTSTDGETTPEAGSKDFYSVFHRGLADPTDQFGRSHFQDLLLMFRHGQLVPGSGYWSKLASSNVAGELSTLARLAEIDPEVAESLRERLDWTRLNDHFSKVTRDLQTYQKLFKLTVAQVEQAGVTGFPSSDLYFVADNVEWKGQLEVRLGRHNVPLVRVTLPCDGFLVSSPTVSGVPTLGKTKPLEYPHRTFPHFTPIWDKIEPSVKAKIPAIRAFVNSFFHNKKPTDKLKIDVLSCVAEQRVDIEVTIPNVVSLVIQFEVGLPVSKPPPDAASAKLWEEW